MAHGTRVEMKRNLEVGDKLSAKIMMYIEDTESYYRVSEYISL